MVPRQTVVNLSLSVTADGANQALTQVKNGRTFGSPGVEAGGRIVLGTATTAGVLVKDANGVVLHDATVTANKDVAPIPMGVKGPLTATITASNGTLTIYWSVKK